MARVPIPAGNAVQLRPMTDAKFRPADNGGGLLGGVGSGLQQLGQATGQFAQAQDHLSAQLDEANTKQAVTALGAFGNEALITGDGAYLTLNGKQAVEARPGIEKAIASKISELSSSLNSPRAKLMFADAAARERERFGINIAEHAVRQLSVYNDQTDSAMQGQSGQDMTAAALRNDADGVDFARGTLTNSITKQYERNGLSGAPAQLAIAKAISGVQSGVVDAKTLTDPVGAAAYIHDHLADFLPSDLAKLNASLYRPLLERQGAADVTALLASEAGVVAPPVAAPAPGGGSTVARMVAITSFSESRNRERDGNGRLVTSSAGAQGRMQVMPTTNTDPGYGVRPAADSSDAERSRVGRDYIAALTKHYGGDPAKGWAAYNWGPGNFDNAMRKHGGDVAAVLNDPKTPKETRDYVNKNVAMLGVTAAGPTYAPRRDDLNGLYAKIDAQPWDFDRKKAAREHVDDLVARDDKLLARVQADAYDQATTVKTQLGEGFTSVNQLPPKVVRSLSPQALSSLTNEARQNAAPKAIPSDGSTYVGLHLLSISNPEAFKKEDLRLYRSQMTPGEWAGLAADWTKMRAAPPEQSTTANSRSEIDGAIGTWSKVDGTNLALDKSSTEPERQRYMKVYGLMRTYLDRATEGGKRKPTDDDTKAAYDYATMNVIARGVGRLGGDETKRVYDVDPAKASGMGVTVPKDIAARIVSSVQRTGGRVPAPSEIGQIYLRYKGAPGYWR